MNKLTKEGTITSEQAANIYATKVIVDLDDCEEYTSPEITWYDYHTDVADAFIAGAVWAKKNLKL